MKKYKIELSPLECSYITVALRLANAYYLNEDKNCGIAAAKPYFKLLNFFSELEPTKKAGEIIGERNRRVEQRKIRDWLKLFEK